MALTTIDFKATFALDSDPKELIIEDISNYSGQVVTGATGQITLTTPSGSVIVENITDAVTAPRTNDNPILLPVLATGEVVPGTYTVSYQVTETAPSSSVVTLEKKFDFTYESPEIDISLTADCIIPELKSSDNTPYVFKGVTPTITRDHKIFYPASLELPSIDGTTQVINVSLFYTTQHQSKITSSLLYEMSYDYFISDEVTGTETIDVTCDSQVCDVYCCVNTAFDNMLAQAGVNNTLFNKYAESWVKMSSAVSNMRSALLCNRSADISKYVDYILKVGNCQPGCGCIDGEPVQVVGISGAAPSGGNTVVQGGGSPVIVTSNTVGDTTTYTVSLDPAFVSKVNSLFNTTVLAGAGIQVNEAVDGNGNKFYEIVSLTSATINMLSFRISLDIEPATTGGVPSNSVSDITLSGTAFDNSGIVVENRYSDPSLFLAQSVGFKVKNIWASQGALRYKASVQVVRQQEASNLFFTGSGQIGGIIGVNPFQTSGLVRAEIVENINEDTLGNGRIEELRFMLFDTQTGTAMTGQKLRSILQEVDLHVILTA